MPPRVSSVPDKSAKPSSAVPRTAATVFSVKLSDPEHFLPDGRMVKVQLRHLVGKICLHQHVLNRNEPAAGRNCVIRLQPAVKVIPAAPGVPLRVGIESINAAMKAQSSESFGYTTEKLVSSDIIGMTYGSLFDANQTMVTKIDDDTYQVQVVSWYDNENSYTSQMVRTIKYFAELK